VRKTEVVNIFELGGNSKVDFFANWNLKFNPGNFWGFISNGTHFEYYFKVKCHDPNKSYLFSIDIKSPVQADSIEEFYSKMEFSINNNISEKLWQHIY
jgi:hypothetical protein